MDLGIYVLNFSNNYWCLSALCPPVSVECEFSDPIERAVTSPSVPVPSLEKPLLPPLRILWLSAKPLSANTYDLQSIDGFGAPINFEVGAPGPMVIFVDRLLDRNRLFD